MLKTIKNKISIRIVTGAIFKRGLISERKVRKRGRITGIDWACKKSFFLILPARRTSQADAIFASVFLRTVKTNMLKLTGLDGRATLRDIFPGEIYP